MISIEEFEELTQIAADELPDVFFDELSGGVVILEDVKLHPDRVADDLYIMGEYHRAPLTGKVIYLYYGSFAAVYGRLGRDEIFPHIRETLRHEFRHHLEGLAGDRSLEREDERDLDQYFRGR